MAKKGKMNLKRQMKFKTPPPVGRILIKKRAGRPRTNVAGSLFECTVCNKKFTRKTHLIGHGRVHTGERPYKCDLCGQRFRNCSNMKEHRRIHTGERPYNCYLCDLTFLQTNHLKKHLKSCIMKVNPNSRPQKKKSSKETEDFPCLFCNLSYLSRAYLEEHLLKIHFSNIKVCFRCDICGNGYKSISKYYDHKMDHDEEPKLKYQCHICGDYFDLFCVLETHLKGHEDLNLFRCEHCGKTFPNLSNLNIHLNDEHKLELPQKEPLLAIKYEVEGESSSDQKDNSFKHKKELKGKSVKRKSTESISSDEGIIEFKHEKSGDKPKKGNFECQYCNRTFTLKRIWEKHVKWHSTDAAKASQEESDVSVPDIDVDDESSSDFDGPKRRSFSRRKQHKKHDFILKPSKSILPYQKGTPTLHGTVRVKAEVVNDGTPSADGTFTCKICDLTFIHLNYYNNHMRIHLTLNPELSCRACNLTFDTVEQLNIHRKQHVKDRLRQPRILHKVYIKKGTKARENAARAAMGLAPRVPERGHK